MMHKFATGLITGSLIGIAGLAWALSDTKTRKRMARDSKRAVRKANEMIDNVHDFF
ncbi:MAG: hypothetical protein LBU32_07155 [Clostridiales bacterium]|jgi:hypothetical protein|nr:hypothetical protein [Clostridiales bacterium]